MDETRLPEDWEKEFGYRIVDPDGWRNAGQPWDQKVTRAEFEALSASCTIDLFNRKRPL